METNARDAHLTGSPRINHEHDHIMNCDVSGESTTNIGQGKFRREPANDPEPSGEQLPLIISTTEGLREIGEGIYVKDYTIPKPPVKGGGASRENDVPANPIRTVEKPDDDEAVTQTLSSTHTLICMSPMNENVVVSLDDAEVKEEFCSDYLIDPARWPEHIVDLVDDDVLRIPESIIISDTNNNSPNSGSLPTFEPVVVAEANTTSPTVSNPALQRSLLIKRKPMPPADQEKRAQLQAQLLRSHLATDIGSSRLSRAQPPDTHSKIQCHLPRQETHKASLGGNSMEGCSTIEPQTWQEGFVGSLDAQKEEDFDPFRELQAAYAEAKATISVFEEARKKYKTKKRAGENTREDDINYLTLITKEQIRETQFQKCQKAILEMLEWPVDTQEISEDDTLFVPTDKCNASNNIDLLRSENPEPKTSQAQFFASEQAPKQPHRNRRQQNKVSEELIAVGMEAERLKEMRKAKKGRGTGVTRLSKGGSSRKTKAGRVGKGRSQPKSLFRNFNSLFTSNVYADGNRNHGITLPTSTPKNKRKALDEIVAAIPLEDKTTAKQDANDLIAASKTLGLRQCRRDPSGDWKLNGMKSLLRPYQILAAAAMKDREDGISKPAGGILGDEMDFGKTVTTIAAMIANPPPKGDPCKTTLIVVPASILWQWQDEIRRHAEPGRVGRLVVYHSTQKLTVPDSEDIYAETDVILTTYEQVRASFPVFKPPKELTTFNTKRAWFKQQLEGRGLLHRLRFYRVVLDESQMIKNYLSQTSKAVRALEAKFRWAISGTPMQNRVDELYPYFKFLRVPHSGSIDVFRQKFCEQDEDIRDICNARVQAILKQFLIRRTHSDLLMGQKLISLTENHVTTVHVEFSRVERVIYETIKKIFVKKINSYSKAGNIKFKYNNVLTMLLVLRQLCSHLYLVQSTIEDIFLLEDFEKLWRLTTNEVAADEAATADHPRSRDMLVEMSALFQSKEKLTGTQVEPPSSEEEAMDQNLQASRPLVFNFRQQLRDLALSDNFSELRARSVCAKCRDSALEPHITSCFHLYCGECLKSMSYESALRNEDHTACIECGSFYESASPCPALKELGFEEASRIPNLSNQDDSLTTATAKRSPRWIATSRSVAPSSKAAAVLAQIREWREAEPACKIVVFTQFRLMIKVLARLCGDRQWGYCVFHGGMSHQTRNNVIKEFREKDEMHIMIASLKCGGVGLNLTMATRVICIDPWWNSPVEKQAFCRVYRIGQTQETFVTRIVVKETVDDKLLQMQQHKETVINDAIGDGKRTGKLSVKDLMRLFGTLSDDTEDEDGPEFIIVEDESESAMHLDEEYRQEQPTYEDVVMLD